MKRLIGLLLVIIIGITGVSLYQRNISVDHQNGDYSLISQATQLEPDTMDSISTLELSSIQLKVDNQMKSKLALIYDREFVEEEFNNRLRDEYVSTYQKDFSLDAITFLGQAEDSFTNQRSSIELILGETGLAEYDLLLASYNSLMTTVESKNLNEEEFKTQVNTVKKEFEAFISTKLNPLSTPLEEEVLNLQNQVEFLEILDQMYVSISESIDSGSSLASIEQTGLKFLNVELLKHASVTNDIDSLVLVVEGLLEAEGINGLAFISDTSFSDNDLSKVETYTTYHKALSTILESKTKEFETTLDTYEKYELMLDDLNTAKKEGMQQVLTDLNDINIEISDALLANENELLVDDLETMVINNIDKNIASVDVADFNDKEVYIILDVKDLSSLNKEVLINDFKSIEQVDSFSVYSRDLAELQLRYLSSEMKSSELINSLNLKEELEYQIESLGVIELHPDGKQVKTDYYLSLKDIEASYEEDVNDLLDKSISLLPASLTSDEIDLVLEMFAINILEINQSYEQAFNGNTSSLLDGYKAYDLQMLEVEKTYVSVNERDIAYPDKEGVATIISMVEEYFEESSEDYDFAALLSKLDHYKFMGLKLDDSLGISFRIVFEGDTLYRINEQGVVDQKATYIIGGKPSGENAIRVNNEAEDISLMFDLKVIGLSQMLYIGLGILIMYLAIYFIKPKLFRKVIVFSLLILIAAIVIYPVLWIVGSSFNKGQSLLSAGISPFPKEPSLLQYQRLFLTTDYGFWFLNTLKIALINMVFSVILTVSTAYALSRFKFRGKKPMVMSLLILQVFPSFLGMVAIYTLLSRITWFSAFTGTASLLDTHFGLLLVYVAGQIPYNSWLVKGYFDTIPMSVDEAARIDGATHLQAFFKVILPLGRPIISFVAITNFMGPWMDFIFPRLILDTPEKKTLAIGLYEMINGQGQNNFTMFAAGAVLVAVPITILFSYFQKFIVTGLASGAVKG